MKDKGRRVIDEGGCVPYFKNELSVIGQSFHYYISSFVSLKISFLGCLEVVFLVML